MAEMSTPLNKEPWDALLDRMLRGASNAEKHEIHLELRRRVRLGWQGNERIAPLRLFTQR